MDEDIGHSLVHYLYTGEYQTLKSVDASKETSSDTTGQETRSYVSGRVSILEYKRSVRLYCIARTYGLERLVMWSKAHMKLLDGSVSIWDILEIAEEAYSKLPHNELWFAEYLKGTMQAALHVDKTLPTRNEFLSRIGRVKRFDQALMRIVAEIYVGVAGAEDLCGDNVREEAASGDLEPPLQDLCFGESQL